MKIKNPSGDSGDLPAVPVLPRVRSSPRKSSTTAPKSFHADLEEAPVCNLEHCTPASTK